MRRRRIRAHYEQVSESESGRIIGLKEGGWNHADWGRIAFSDESRFQLCLDDHRRCVWRRPRQQADSAFTIACPTDPQPGTTV
ncbi:uncharacterized protein TNCV_36821 [Trichonephila clavipes]|nr:uncharacterized protein TNCV_36821 [Trichonephila clavipes]